MTSFQSQFLPKCRWSVLFRPGTSITGRLLVLLRWLVLEMLLLARCWASLILVSVAIMLSFKHELKLEGVYVGFAQCKNKAA